MNQLRSNFIYELVGIVREKKKKQVKNRECLQLAVETQNKVPTIKVYPDKLTNQQIWQEILNNKFIDKKYTFYCQNYFGQYHLVNWKELREEDEND